MTDEIPTTTEPTEPADKAEPEASTEADTANGEAARYRTRLRATEAERDALTERMTTWQRREAERHAAATLANPADLWLDGADVAALLDDDGEVDAEKVAAAVAGVTSARPQLAAGYRPKPKPDDAQGARVHRPAVTEAWSDLLKGQPK